MTAKEIARKFKLLQKWAKPRNKGFSFLEDEYPSEEFAELFLEEIKNQLSNGKSWEEIELETIIADP